MAISTIGTSGINQAADTILCGTSGNVGIGTPPSAWNPIMKAVEFPGGNSVIGYNSQNLFLGCNTYWDGADWRAKLTAGGSIFGLGQSSIYFYMLPSVSAGSIQTVVPVVSISDTGNLQFNSGYGALATAYGCRAWVNFNGTGTVAIRASGNVSSITDNTTGDYTVNFTTAMPDANYAANFTVGGSPSEPRLYAPTGILTTSVRVQAFISSGGSSDPTTAVVTVHR